MARIEFHFNAPALVAYTCRLLRKVHARGLRAQVVGHPSTLAQLDQALWTFAAEEFIPHASWSADQVVQARTPILIADHAAHWPGAQVLVNALPLAKLPPGYEGYARVVEIVGLDDDSRAAARQRWRAYQALGYPIQRHDVAAAG